MSFLSHLKQITALSITDAHIVVRDISRAEKKIVSEHRIDLPVGVVVRGIVSDRVRFTEALTNLRAQTGGNFHKIIFTIPEEQCFTCTCVTPVDISKEEIRTKVIIHAKTILPIRHSDMYIGYFEPTPISSTNTQSCVYMAMEGDVFDTYIQIFETVHIEVSGVTSADAVDPTFFIPISDFKQEESALGHVKIKTTEVAQSKTSVHIDTARKKQIATYAFLAAAFVVLGYIMYKYIIVLFI